MGAAGFTPDLPLIYTWQARELRDEVARLAEANRGLRGQLSGVRTNVQAVRQQAEVSTHTHTRARAR